METLNNKIISELKKHGVDFIHFVDISGLSEIQNKSFHGAVFFGITFTSGYIKEVSSIPDYVQQMINNGCDFSNDELYTKEHKADAISDELAEYLRKAGYDAYSLSEKNQLETGFMEGCYGATPLPHKTIAVLAGLGWIGKNNLLINPKFGTAFSTGAVLTTAPFDTIFYPLIESKCGNCTVCYDICEPGALKSTKWNTGKQREDMIDVTKCITCMKCSAFCPWTQLYMEKGLKNG